jgi:hypothetical protein
MPLSSAQWAIGLVALVVVLLGFFLLYRRIRNRNGGGGGGGNTGGLYLYTYAPLSPDGTQQYDTTFPCVSYALADFGNMMTMLAENNRSVFPLSVATSSQLQNSGLSQYGTAGFTSDSVPSTSQGMPSAPGTCASCQQFCIPFGGGPGQCGDATANYSYDRSGVQYSPMALGNQPNNVCARPLWVTSPVLFTDDQLSLFMQLNNGTRSLVYHGQLAQ